MIIQELSSTEIETVNGGYNLISLPSALNNCGFGYVASYLFRASVDSYNGNSSSSFSYRGSDFGMQFKLYHDAETDNFIAIDEYQ